MYAPKFKIRCSSISNIMAGDKLPGLTDKQKAELKELHSCEMGELLTDKGNVVKFTTTRKEKLADLIEKRDNPKTPGLTAGAKTICQDWLTSKVYNRRKEFTAKATEKGNRMEDDAIALLAEYESDPFMIKNEASKSCRYIQGTCDVRTPNEVYDTKCSKNPFTFPVWSEAVDNGYHDQLQGYGHLYSRKSLVLAYCLVSTPEDMIERDAYYKTKGKYGPDFTESQHAEILEEEIRNNTYDDIPIQLRVKLYRFDFDPAFIERVIERVKMCREYIVTLEKGLIAEGKHPLYFEETTQLTALKGTQKKVA
jgi:hypothetical protein